MIESFVRFCVHNQSSSCKLCYENDPQTQIWHHQMYNRSKIAIMTRRLQGRLAAVGIQ